MRWLVPVMRIGLVLTAQCNGTVFAQAPPHSLETNSKSLGTDQPAVLDGLRLIGLRHLLSAAVAAQLSLRPGEPFDAAKLQHDLRTLARLGWFKSIRVEETSRTVSALQSFLPQQRVTLIFHFEEEPILSRFEYSGSRLLSQSQIEKLLEENKLTPGLGKPANPATLYRMALAIQSALNELGHPDASVQIQRQTQMNSTVSIRFAIVDGPHLPVRQVRFEGDTGVSERLLRTQIQSIAPWKPLASLRGKDGYLRAAYEEDRQRILTYYADHGYPEARVGNARVEQILERSRKWFPLPHHSTQPGLLLSIPVHGGQFYRLESVEPSPTLQRAFEEQTGKPLLLPVTQGRAFSQQDVDKLRRFCNLRLQANDWRARRDVSLPSVDANPILDPDKHSVRLKLNLSDSPPYLVHRLEFQGLHRFSDRFIRRRIPLREGHPLDERALEIGLTKLARTGYFKPMRKENIHIQLDDAGRTADISIHLEEIGQQRVTFDGGRAQFGSTLGLAYTVFDLLNHEELLTAKLEGGPESVQLLLGIAKEGVLLTRGSLAFSVFDNVIRPRFIHGVQGPFTTSRSLGISVPWTYAISNSDSFGVNYTLARSTSDQKFGSGGTSDTTTVQPIDFQTHTSNRSLATAWAHDTGNEHISFSDSASGSFLGGDENMLRSSGEAARIFRDPLFSPANSWAFRTIFNAAGSYRGEAPNSSRFFPGDEFVRGLGPGELGPVAMTERATPSGLLVPSPSYAGANLLTATNAEYRIPLRHGLQAAGFFDLGSGWLLPNWLGPTKPNLLSATNGVLHGSTGIQLQWTIPGVQVPFRSYCALTVLRLDRVIPLSEKSLLHPHHRRGAFGWGLGSFF